jgi:MarR family transcriptional regulator for hemolysin
LEINERTMQQSPQERFGLWLGLVARLWRAEIDRRLSPHGLTEAKWFTLLTLSRLHRPVTQQELAATVGVRGPTLVRTLDWLEGEGLIERQQGQADRRSKLVHVTARAVPALEQIESTAMAVRAEIFAGIPQEEVSTCLRVLEQLASKLNDAPKGTQTNDDTQIGG